MIAFGRSYAYSVQGRKVDEILQLLNKGYDFTYVKDEKEFMSVVASLQKKVDELNKKYPKTVKYAVVGKLSAQEGSITIGTVGTAVRTKGIFLHFWSVKPMSEGGEV